MFLKLNLPFSETNLKPKSPAPTKISQEPGVNGVTKAKIPIIIKVTPMIFLKTLFIVYFLLPKVGWTCTEAPLTKHLMICYNKNA